MERLSHLLHMEDCCYVGTYIYKRVRVWIIFIRLRKWMQCSHKYGNTYSGP
jgi:hypothetical protein